MRAFLTSICLGTAFFAAAISAFSAEPIFPAVQSSKVDPLLKAQVLIEELNCVACHGGTGEALAANSKKAPRLAEVAGRVNPHYAEAFISDPDGMKPGTSMPDVLGGLGAEEKTRVAREITHFLWSRKAGGFSPQAPDPVAARLGKDLFHSRGCAACHSPRDEKGAETMSASSVPLGALEKKYSVPSLVKFLRAPHASRPSGRMPDLRLQARDAERIAHFLLRNTKVPGALSYTLYRGQVWEGLSSAEVKAERGGQVQDFSLGSFGKLEQHSAVRYEGWLHLRARGDYSFFLTLNGGSLVVDGKMIAELPPSDRRGTKSIEGRATLEAGAHPITLTYFHTGREPKLAFEMSGPEFARGPIPSALLSVTKDPIPPFEPLKVDADLATRGREHFSKYGCASCHDDLNVPPQKSLAFSKLNAQRGCLSEGAGAWPRFELSAAQRALITQALPRAEDPSFSEADRISKSLVTFNCIACHERAGVGGIAPERNAFFTGTQPALGDQGRIPPPLTDVGAKLRPEWLREVLLRGGRQRDYLDAVMPQFGEANVGHLVELFDRVDRLEAATLPAVGNLQESKAAGYEMVGTNGLSCVACHEFNGQKAGEVSAVDIARVPERLKKNWFALYMRQPSRFHPTVIMPSYWPDGRSTRPNILGGDTALQIDALWQYLSDGPRAKKPAGLSRQSNELRVGDVAEICRGRGPAGYRGIGVGYPERINLVFDSGEMALRQLWRGDFATVDFGSFSPRGSDVLFPAGIPFHRLDSLEAPWPYKGKTNYTFPQDHGYEFRGYHLDAKRRPTFLYTYGDITVTDFFEDARSGDGPAFFKRVLRFSAPAPQASFYFRAATGRKPAQNGDHEFQLGKLQLRITSDHRAIVRDGEPAEVLIPLELPKGETTVTLEYRW